ncbi:MAG: hypothetical protein R3Y40_07135 [Eubacteriales bacterium]
MKMKEGFESKPQGGFRSMLGLVTNHTLKHTLRWGGMLILIQAIIFLYLGMEQEISSLPLHLWVDDMFVKYSFIGVLIITSGICANGVYANENARYTVQRLGVSRRKIFAAWMANGICTVLIIWGIQLACLMLCSGYYIWIADGAGITSQTILLSSYRSEFFHMILPIQDISLWIRNLSFILFLGASVAYHGMKKLQGINSMAFVGCIFMILLNFNLESGMADYYSAPLLFICTLGLMKGGVSHEI